MSTMTTTPLLYDEASLSELARGLTGSEILRISGQITALKAEGREICNLTVGDFSPAEFRIPARLEALLQQALAAGHTNYPPSAGDLALLQAGSGAPLWSRVLRHCRRLAAHHLCRVRRRRRSRRQGCLPHPLL